MFGAVMSLPPLPHLLPCAGRDGRAPTVDELSTDALHLLSWLLTLPVQLSLVPPPADADAVCDHMCRFLSVVFILFVLPVHRHVVPMLPLLTSV